MTADRYSLWRKTLADGEQTTIFAVRHPAARVLVLHFPEPRRLDVWCRDHGVDEAIVGNFFLRDPYRALGEPSQFDSDITDGRHPRAALGLAGDELIAVACDGRRSGVDAGLTMLEPATVMLERGAADAINLDGGGSTTLVPMGHLLNRPYSAQDQPAPESRPVVSALAFE